MSRLVDKDRAIRALRRRGYDVFEQRGFYSHFLRVRHPTSLETITTIDIEAGRVLDSNLNGLTGVDRADPRS